MVEKLVSDPFLKNQKWVYLWINSFKFYMLFLLHLQVEGYRNILNEGADHLLLPHVKLFQKTKIGLELVSLVLYGFWRKIFFTLYSINWPICIAWLPNLAFLSSRFSRWPKKSGQKFKNLKNEKSFYDEIKNIFHYF